MTIKLLPDTVINQIAAGEVVERPASIVRELVDNSIDAGADSITISVVGGGITEILVADNGSGMSKEDARRAPLRHATSKISEITDLTHLNSLGFRGEALASIASVAQLTIRTRDSEAKAGVEFQIQDGEATTEKSIPMNQGSEFIVRNLFWNTPARRKFLKTERTEFSKIKEWVISSALAHVGIEYIVIHDGERVLHFPKDKDLASRARTVLGGRGIPVPELEFTGGILVQGWVRLPSESGSKGESLTILVNHRPVSDKMIARAVRDAFGAMLKFGDSPSGVIDITINGEFVDVNVHPQKSEVRFAAPQEVYMAVRSAVKRALQSLTATQDMRENSFAPVRDGSTGVTPNFSGGSWPNTPRAAVDLPRAQESVTWGGWNNEAEAPLVESTPWKYIGQVFKCFLLWEDGDRLLVVDMHAAHERMRFNEVLERFTNKSPHIQKLLIPLTLKLDARELDAFETHKDPLNRFGFEYEISQERKEVYVTSVPDYLDTAKSEKVLKEVAAVPEGGAPEGLLVTLQEKIASRLACHSSVRSGDTLSPQEAETILRSIDKLTACPHGRPVAHQISKEEMGGWFSR
jgi:DNA mismatch repair protein MutL